MFGMELDDVIQKVREETIDEIVHMMYEVHGYSLHSVIIKDIEKMKKKDGEYEWMKQ